MSRWFRMYDDLLDDPKVQRLDPVLFKTWVNLLCLASRNDGRLPAIGDIAFALRISDDVASSRLNDLFDKGLLDVGDDESNSYSPHNWDRRQYKSDRDDTAAERQRRKRDKGKQSPVTDENVTRDVTDVSQPPETEQNRTERDMSETSSDVPAAEKKKRAKNDYPQDFQTFYAAYPADPGMSKPEALKAWLKLPEEDRDRALKAIPAFKVWVSKQGKDYRTVHACRYLSQRRFEGFDQSEPKTPTVKLHPVKEGSFEWGLWSEHNGKPFPVTDLRDDKGHIIGRGWYCPSQYPPNKEARAA